MRDIGAEPHDVLNMVNRFEEVNSAEADKYLTFGSDAPGRTRAPSE
jgi:hypothetical protein